MPSHTPRPRQKVWVVSGDTVVSGRRMPPTETFDSVAAVLKPTKGRRSLSDSSTDLNESIREQKRCRNCTSAVRHRRRKEREDDMGRQEKELVNRNKWLQASIEELKNLCLHMKSLLMSHSMCGSDPIDQYHLQSAQSGTDGSGNSGVQAACDAARQAVIGLTDATAPTVTSPGPTNLTSGSAFENGFSHSIDGLPTFPLLQQDEHDLVSPLSACSDLSTSTALNRAAPTHGGVRQDVSLDHLSETRHLRKYSSDSRYQSYRDFKSEMVWGIMSMDEELETVSSFGPDSAIWSLLREMTVDETVWLL